MGPAADGVDLLTIAAHEIGHALGLDTNNTAWKDAVESGIFLPVTAPRPFAGSTIILNGLDHLDDPTALIYPMQEPGERKLISAEDALANAQISQFSGRLNLDPDAVVVPEPGSLALMACGIISAACWHWAQRKRRSKGWSPTRLPEPDSRAPGRGGGEVANSPA